MSEKLKIYWTPGNFKLQDESWSYLYAYPQQVAKNKFVFKSTIEDKFKLPMEEITRIQKGKVHRGVVESEAMLAIYQPSRSDKPDHALIQYNMNWHLFSEEAVKVKTTLPSKEVPVKDASFDEEVKDISLWYTQFGLKYHIPLSAKSFELERDTALLYVEIDTDKEVEFVRYNQTNSLHNLAEEYYGLKLRYGRASSDEEIEEGIRNSHLPDMVLSEILKNIV